MAECAINQHCLRTDYPINLSFAKSGGASAVRWYDQDRFPNLVCIISDCRRRRFGVNALHALFILVYANCWRARRCFVIFGCRVILVHGFRYRATQPRSYSLDSTVTPLRDAVTFWHISTLVLHSSVKSSKVCLQKAGTLSVRISAGAPHSKKTDFSSRTMADAS